MARLSLSLRISFVSASSRLGSSLCLVSVLCAAGASAQSVKLNGPLARPIGGDVLSYQINADGSRVVYLADQERDDVFELYCVKPGATPIRLNAPLPEGSDVGRFELTPDGQRVVYLTQDETGTFDRFFSVPIDGGASVRLSDPESIHPFRPLSSFEIDPTSRYVVFLASEGGPGQRIYSAPIDGSTPAVSLAGNGDTPFGFQVGRGRVVCSEFGIGTNAPLALFSVPLDGRGDRVDFAGDSGVVTPDGRRVLYSVFVRPRQVTRQVLYSAPIDGRGAPVQLFLDSTNDFRISPDSQRVVLSRADGLYSFPVLGGEAPTFLGGRVTGSQFEIDSEGSRVVFVDRRDLHLYGVPILGGAVPARIDGPGAVSQFQLTKDKRVVYVESHGDDWTFPREHELFCAPASGQGSPVLLATARSEATPGFSVARDSVLFFSVTNAPARPEDAVCELFTVPLDGSRPPLRLNDELVAERRLQVPLVLSADGSRVAFLADQETHDAFELFSAPSNGSRATLKLNPALPLGPVEGDVSAARFSADGTRAVFLADAREDEVQELFRVSTAGGVAPIRLNGDLVPGGDVVRFDLTPERVVYLADERVNGLQELFSVPIAGGAPVRLNGATSTSILTFDLTPDGTRVVYRVYAEGFPTSVDLYGVQVDGSSPSTLLASNLDSGYAYPDPDSYRAYAIAISRSGSVVYLDDRDGDDWYDLFSVPAAGGLPVRLGDALPSGGFLRGFRIAPGGQRVLGLHLSRTTLEARLFSVPIDGSPGTIELSGDLPPGSSVSEFATSQDGSFVVFSAGVDHEYELFRAPVDGSAAPVPLHTASANSPEISPDGARVVYLVRALEGAYELHSVRTDGSAPPVVLGRGLASDAYFPRDLRLAFEITPDSATVVFRADSLPGTFRLFSVAIDGRRSPIELTPPNGEQATVRIDYRLTPDGRTVVYRMGESAIYPSLGDELFQVSVLGRSIPRRINGPGDRHRVTVLGFEISPDGRRVLHRTTQDSPDVIELYASPVTQGPRSSRM